MKRLSVIYSQIIAGPKPARAGTPKSESCHEDGISSATLYK